MVAQINFAFCEIGFQTVRATLDRMVLHHALHVSNPDNFFHVTLNFNHFLPDNSCAFSADGY